VTLDEARSILGVARGASHASVRDAFRLRARQVHPDSHPTASPAQRSALAREFDRAREARDILLLLPDGALMPGPSTGTVPSPPHRPPAPPPPPPPWRPPPDSATRPHQRTLRFDEFVRVVDAAGFGPGHRSSPHRDTARLIVWSTVGALSAGVLASVIWTVIAS
jgi:hypothetical protein